MVGRPDKPGGWLLCHGNNIRNFHVLDSLANEKTSGNSPGEPQAISDLIITGAREMSPNADLHQPSVAEILFRDGNLQTMDERALPEEVGEVVPGFQRDFTVIKDQIQNMSPWLDKAHLKIEPGKPVGTRYLRTLFSGKKPNF